MNTLKRLDDCDLDDILDIFNIKDKTLDLEIMKQLKKKVAMFHPDKNIGKDTTEIYTYFKKAYYKLQLIFNGLGNKSNLNYNDQNDNTLYNYVHKNKIKSKDFNKLFNKLFDEIYISDLNTSETLDPIYKEKIIDKTIPQDKQFKNVNEYREYRDKTKKKPFDEKKSLELLNENEKKEQHKTMTQLYKDLKRDESIEQRKKECYSKYLMIDI